MKGIQDLLYKFQDNPNSTLSDVESRIRDAKLNDLKRPEGSFQFKASEESFLGAGSFGYVYIGSYASTTIAVKIVEPPKGFDLDDKKQKDKAKKRIENEILLMNYLSHPTIVQCYGYCMRGMISN